MSKGKTPKAPDAAKVSQAQTDSNIRTAQENLRLNSQNQYTPYGSLTYAKDANGLPTSQTVSLTPSLQGLLDSQISSQRGVSDAVSGAIGRLPSDSFDPSGINTDQIAQTSFNRRAGLLQPGFDQAAKELDVNLANRGLPVGSEIYVDERNRYDRAKNESLASAAQQADLDALNESQRQYGNAMTEYQLPLQQLSALMGNSQAVNNPSFQNTPNANVANTDVAGNIWNSYAAKAQQANNQNGNLWGGLLGLGKLGLSAYTGGMF